MNSSKQNEIREPLLSPRQASRRYNVSLNTLRRWIMEGHLTDHRTPGGHRRYDPSELDRLFGCSQKRSPMQAQDANGIHSTVLLVSQVCDPDQKDAVTGQHTRILERVVDPSRQKFLDLVRVSGGDESGLGELVDVLVDMGAKVTMVASDLPEQLLENFKKGG